MTIENAQISDLQMEIEIAAPAEQVWTALTKNIGEWWPAEFFTGGEAGTREFSLEAIPGGRMMETWGDGGFLWGTVISVVPNSLLHVVGSTFPAWGGPTDWYGTWELSSRGKNTLLKFSEYSVGRVSDSGTQEKDKGWSFLWSSMKANIEGTATPVWVD